MENKLEQLLNSLVKLGWKPYGIPRVKNVTLLNRYVSFSKRTILGIEFFEYTLRSLASKESGLWQFVCENGMIYSTPDDRGGPNYNWLEDLFNCGWKHPDYWLMESALCDEYKLGDFLLSNIKVEGKNEK